MTLAQKYEIYWIQYDFSFSEKDWFPDAKQTLIFQR